MSDRPRPFVASSSQTVGPFFHFGPGDHPQLGSLLTPGTVGERIALRIAVLDGDRAPVPDAMIELWQADADGQFKGPTPGAPRTETFCGFGRLPTGADGTCTFTTVRPGRIAPDDAAHINVCLFMRGMLRHIYTRLYFDGDPDLENDRVLALVPADRRVTLMARRDSIDAATWTFDIHLQGDHETVFFDL